MYVALDQFLSKKSYLPFYLTQIILVQRKYASYETWWLSDARDMSLLDLKSHNLLKNPSTKYSCETLYDWKLVARRI